MKSPLALLALCTLASAAATAQSAAGALYGVAYTHPDGAFFANGQLFVSDRILHFCQVEQGRDSFFAPPPGIGESDPVADCTFGQNTPAHPGQAAVDVAGGFIYVSDNGSSPKGSLGVERFLLAAPFGGVPGFVLAQGQGLAGLRPTALALGPDGELYLGAVNTGDVRRIDNPAGAAQTVHVIGKSLRGKRVFQLAFIGNDLWLAESDGLTVIRNAVGCQSGCTAKAAPGVPAGEVDALATDGADTLFFTQGNTVFKYTLSTATASAYATHGQLTADQLSYAATAPNGSIIATSCGADGSCPFTFAGLAAALALDPAGNLYVGEDPTLDLNVHGRLWVVPPQP